MNAPLNLFTSVPWSAEAVAFRVTVPAGTTTVLSNIPSIHAHSITVFVEMLGGALSAPGVTIRKYAANRQIQVDTNVIGALIAPNSAAADSVLPVGQTYDILVTTAANATLNIWTCARSV
jgi:hypothetical protein